MSAAGPSAGVVSPELCWSAHGNELRVYSAVKLESHAGHGTSGLPESAVFRFFSEIDEAFTKFGPDKTTLQGLSRGTGEETARQTNTQKATVNASHLSATPAQSSLVMHSVAASTIIAGGTRGRPAGTVTQKNRHGISAANAASALISVGSASEGSPCGFGLGSSSGHGSFKGGISPEGSSKLGSDGPRMSRDRAAKKLHVRAVAVAGTRDGRTVLLCLVSERELASEVHCLDPTSGETLSVATGLPMMLTSMAVVPRPPRQPSPSSPLGKRVRRESGSEMARRKEVLSLGWLASQGHDCSGGDVADMHRDNDVESEEHCEEIVVAVGGLGGRIELVGLQVPVFHDGSGLRSSSLSPSSPLSTCSTSSLPLPRPPRRRPASWPKRGENVPRDREGVPVSSLAAFCVPGDDGSRIVMIAAGWDDGRWAMAPCYHDGSHFYSLGGTNAGGERQGSKYPGPPDGAFDTLWEACSCGDLAAGDTQDMGAVLHIVYQKQSQARPPYEKSRLPKIRVWLSTAKGFLCFETFTTRNDSTPQEVPPLLAQRRMLIPGARPQSLRAMAVGGGPSRPLMAFAAVRPTDFSPILVVLDPEAALSLMPLDSAVTTDADGNSRANGLDVGRLAGGVSAVVAAEGDTSDRGRVAAAAYEKELELSTRCCSKSVISAKPHAVWINPSEVKIFVCGGSGSDGACGSDDGGEIATTINRSAGRARKESEVHLRMSVVVAEASLSEAGRPRLRAWQHSHVGKAHRVGRELEKLGLLAFCEPSQEYLDTNTARCVNAIGEESLQHIIGGEANLWARPLLTSAGAFESVKKVKRQAVEQSAGNMSDPAADAARSEETLLLAARLQGTVSMGLGPTIARALTAIIPDRGGEWMLPTAEPVQEWAISVALRSWEETRIAVSARSLLSAPLVVASSACLLSESVAAFDALVRRSRQVERILLASLERCRQYCEAAETVAGERMTGRRRAAAAQQLALFRKVETAPLSRQLHRAITAARLSLRAASAMQWMVRMSGCGSGKLRERERLSGRGIPGCRGPEKGWMDSSTTSMVGSRKSGPHSGNDSGRRCEMTMIGRLVERAELSSWYPDFGSRVKPLADLEPNTHTRLRSVSLTRVEPTVSSNVGSYASLPASSASSKDSERGEDSCCLGHFADLDDDPTVVLAHVTSAVDRVFRSEEGGSRNGKTDGVQHDGNLDHAAAFVLLQRGLAVIAYSVLSFTYPGRQDQGPPSRDAAAGVQAREERDGAMLEQALASFDNFCKQIILPAEPRTQARLSWLLEHRATVPGAPSLASAALLCPRTSGFLGADPQLLALAQTAIAQENEPLASGGNDAMTTSKQGWYGARAPSSGDASTAEMQRQKDLDENEICCKRQRRDGKVHETHASSCMSGSDTLRSDHLLKKDVLMPHSVDKRPPFVAEPLRSWTSRARGQTDWKTPSRVVSPPRAKNFSGNVATRTPRESCFKPETPGERISWQRSDVAGLGMGMPGTPHERMARARGHTVWETPRGVGLTPQMGKGQRRTRTHPPSVCPADKEAGDGLFPDRTPHDLTSRVRGQTVWETPRGVGLTPTVGERRRMGQSCSPRDRGVDGEAVDDLHFSTPHGRISRLRGQTVWETPRGVGLTPQVGERWRREHSRSPSDRGADDEMVDGCRVGNTTRGRISRARGQTVWETPRGVGLTPGMGARPRTERIDSINDRDEIDDAVDDPGLTSTPHHRLSRARGQTVWETPRGVGLTPGVGERRHRELVPSPGSCDDDEAVHGRHSDSTPHDRLSRARGQTVWETPRGVGLTPKLPEGRSIEQISAAKYLDGGCNEVDARSLNSTPHGRARGQTVWETPRGVGLTPGVEDRRRGGPMHSPAFHDEDVEAICGRNSDSTPHDRLSRARGQTVWETPRGVGLTPRVQRGESTHQSGQRSRVVL